MVAMHYHLNKSSNKCSGDLNHDSQMCVRTVGYNIQYNIFLIYIDLFNIYIRVSQLNRQILQNFQIMFNKRYILTPYIWLM